MPIERYANSATPTAPETAWAALSAGVNAAVTTFNLTTAWRSHSRALIDSEYVLVTAGFGSTTITVQRGIEGSTAATHASGAELFGVLTASGFLGNPGPMTTEGDSITIDSSGNVVRRPLAFYLTPAQAAAAYQPILTFPGDGKLLFDDGGAVSGSPAFRFDKTSGHAAVGHAAVTVDGGADYFGDGLAFFSGLTVRSVYTGGDGAAGYIEGVQAIAVLTPSADLGSDKTANGVDGIVLIPAGEPHNFTSYSNAGVQGYAEHRGSGIVNELNGFSATVTLTGPGTLNYGIGLIAGVSANNGLLDEAAAAWMAAPVVAGSAVLNKYNAIFIEDQSGLSGLSINNAINYAGIFRVDAAGNVVAANLSGTNTGDQDLSAYALTDNVVPNTRTVNSKALTANITITASDVGLGSVDNTSDATKNAAAVTLTNKTLTTPTIGSFANAGHSHQNAAGGGTLAEAALALTDITTANATSSAHGFMPKLSGNAYDFALGDGTYGRTVARGAITTSDPWTFTQTWNAGAVAFTGWKINITKTASASASKVVDIQVGGSTIWSINTDGDVGTTGAGSVSAFVVNGAKVRQGTGVNFQVDAASGAVVANGLMFGFHATSAVNAPDAAFKRVSAGLIEVNTGVSGTIATLRGKYQSSDGSAGVTAGPFTAITAITVKDGIITAISGT